jgi:predicted DNA-binding transcriptional regulator AlpA
MSTSCACKERKVTITKKSSSVVLDREDPRKPRIGTVEAQSLLGDSLPPSGVWTKRQGHARLELLRFIAELLHEGEQHYGAVAQTYSGHDCLGSLATLPTEIAWHRILDTAEAAEFCGFSVPHWRRLYRSGRAPPPIRLSTRKLGWRAGDLIIWLQAHYPSK